MKIFELERETGLDRATIRYYEKEGFIRPVRQENGYRDYSEADQEHLLKIKLLRQLGMSLERIRNLQQGSESFSSALTDQIRLLENRIQSAQQARLVCQRMQESCVRYDTLNARAYLDMLAQPASFNTPNVSRTYTEPAAIGQPHPWRRYFARLLDYTLVQLLLMFLIVVLLRVRPYNDFLSNLVKYGAPFLAVPMMALMLHYLGTTPGKWLFGLEVAADAGGRLSISAALLREWSALRYGYGFGIPFWQLWRLFKSYQACTNSNEMDWDQETACEYICHTWRGKRKLVLAFVSVLLVFVSIFCAHDTIIPAHRGDLTISQFAENYNFVNKILNENVAESELLQENGKKQDPVKPDVNVIIIGGDMTSENRDYSYETTEGKLTKLVYDNTWTNVMFLSPTEEIAYIPAITLLMSQKGTTYLDLVELTEIWEDHQSSKNASFNVRNIEISWKIETENCIYNLAGNYYYRGIPESDSSLKLHLEIVIH